MNKELKYIILDYNQSDLSFINEFSEFIEFHSDKIVEFFDIKNFGFKIKVKLWCNLEMFRNYYKEIGYNLDKNGNVPKWVCGFAHGESVEVLTLDEYKKTQSHENAIVDDLKYLILHEFVHACHKKVSSNNSYSWLSEGLATTISHQYDNASLEFNATLDEIINGCHNYVNYYTMFKYVYNTYGRNYILSLIEDYDLLKKETPKLYEEVSIYVKRYN